MHIQGLEESIDILRFIALPELLSTKERTHSPLKGLRFTLMYGGGIRTAWPVLQGDRAALAGSDAN